MKIGLFAGFVAVLLTLTPAEAGSIPPKSPLAASAGEMMPQKDAQAARPFSAVLRYGPGTTSACQSLSDNSSAICLLLALHVIQLSQKTIAETKL
jgi:hypothetical protein